MGSTPPLSKRMNTRAISCGGKLESWFSGEFELIEQFLHETSRKIVKTPKFVSFTWMKQRTSLWWGTYWRSKGWRDSLRCLEISIQIWWRYSTQTFNSFVIFSTLMWRGGHWNHQWGLDCHNWIKILWIKNLFPPVDRDRLCAWLVLAS